MARLFIAIDPPQHVLDKLATLKTDSFTARWTDPSKIHLTLRFLGEVDSQQINPLSTALTQISSPSFDLQPAGLGVFPSRRAPRVLWVGFQDEPALQTLQKKIEQTVVGLGFEPEKRSFTPHLTIARCKRANARQVRTYMREHKEFSAPAFPTDRFYLYESALHPEGARYMRLQEFGLEAPTPGAYN